MAVAGDAKSRHGIILAKNEPAKKYGIKTAEAIWQAQAKCPNLVLVDSHHEKYEFYSQKLREMYSEYTDRVEPFGLDECWLDMTGIVSDFTEAEEVALEIRNRVKDEFYSNLILLQEHRPSHWHIPITSRLLFRDNG